MSKCKNCGREVKVPIQGYGPVCALKKGVITKEQYKVIEVTKKGTKKVTKSKKGKRISVPKNEKDYVKSEEFKRCRELEGQTKLERYMGK